MIKGKALMKGFLDLCVQARLLITNVTPKNFISNVKWYVTFSGNGIVAARLIWPRCMILYRIITRESDSSFRRLSGADVRPHHILCWPFLSILPFAVAAAATAVQTWFFIAPNAICAHNCTHISGRIWNATRQYFFVVVAKTKSRPIANKIALSITHGCCTNFVNSALKTRRLMAQGHLNWFGPLVKGLRVNWKCVLNGWFLNWKAPFASLLLSALCFSKILSFVILDTHSVSTQKIAFLAARFKLS